MNEDKNKKSRNRSVSKSFVLPFFLVLTVLSIVSFIIPLRPDTSFTEKRTLAEFPEFSLEDLFSGAYFKNLALWYSDTFPGREEWLHMQDRIQEFYGNTDIALSGDLVKTDSIAPDLPSEENSFSEPPSPEPSSEAVPPEETVKEGIIIDDINEIMFGTVIQFGDTVYHYFGFSQYWSDYYITTVNAFADEMAEDGIRVINCLPPSSVGVEFDREYIEMLQCANQEDAIDYIADGMNDKVISVDMFQKLLEHRDEYLFFRTDHHWTALGAYYAYVSFCEELKMEPAPLSDFEVLDEGPFIGSLYWKALNSSKLKIDNLYAYCPPGDITMTVSDGSNYSVEKPLIMDKSNDTEYNKYVSFISGDNPLSTVVNNSIDNDSSCLIIKDSYGNPVVPFLTQNYHTVYAIDFRTFRSQSIQDFVRENDVDDVIFMPMLGMVQGTGANEYFRFLCRYPDYM